MADGSTVEGAVSHIFLIGFLIILVAFLILLHFYWTLKAKLMPKMRTKLDRKSRRASNQTRPRRSSKTQDALLKAKPRPVRTDIKPDLFRKESLKEHLHKDRQHKEHIHKEHQIVKEPHKAVTRMKSLKKIDSSEIQEVASTFGEESKVRQAPNKLFTVLDPSTVKLTFDDGVSHSSLKLDNSVHVEMPYSKPPPASAPSCKMDSEYLANLNALGMNDPSSSSFKRDLRDTLYKQNISLFTNQTSTRIGCEPAKKETSALSDRPIDFSINRFEA